MEKIELLAPAGNEASLNCAINAGADAVYLGLEDFNARGNIENFNIENLRENVKKAHLFGVRVFLTLNTLVFDDEFEKVFLLVRKAIESKVDAFIVQDIGLAYALKNKFPQIELHASTQMGIQNLEGAKFLKNLGFKRVVLARETPLSEIRRIHDNIDIEIEYFVQGALCVSFSGNCYLCSLYANASGNRGRCKQFCRLPIKMQNRNISKEGYLLSTKDFCMLPSLNKLAESGVSSIKIEGRARRPAYVAGAVKVYRDALDNDFKYSQNSITMLKKLFNRGNYISGYLGNEKIIYNKTQNHIGVQIGKVLAFKKGKRFNEIIISSSHKLKKGDAVKFFSNEKEIGSLSVQDIKDLGENKYLITTTNIIQPNCNVNLIVDNLLETTLQNIKRTIKVEGKFEAKKGKRAKLILKSGSVQVETLSESLLEEAKEQPLTKEDCEIQIGKMGENFSLENIVTDLDDVFMAKSQLNKLRRDAVEQLKEKIIEANEEQLNIKEQAFNLRNINKNNRINKKIYYFENLKTLEKYINSKNYLVFSPDDYNLDEISVFCNKYKDNTIYLSLPVIANENDISLLRKLIQNNENLGIVVNNYYGFDLASKEKIIIGSEMNIANSFAVGYYSNLGYNKIILSKENFDFENINHAEAELFVETNFRKTLMHFKHCPFKENLETSCKNCKFQSLTKYKINDKIFTIRRKKLSSCQFQLVEESPSYANQSFGEVEEIFQ